MSLRLGLLFCGAWMFVSAVALAEPMTFGQLEAVWTAKENKGSQTDRTLPTAALLGNGDLGLVNGDLRRGASVVGKRFQLTASGMFSCGRLEQRRDFSKKDIQQVSFGAMELDFGRDCPWEDVLRTDYGDLISKSGSAELRTYVAATENLIITEVKGIALPKVTYSFPDDPDFPHESGEGWGLRRTYNGVPADPHSWQHVGKAVTKAVGRYLVTSFAIDSEPEFKVATEADVAAVRARHEKWWRDWWGRSRVKIPDPVLQRYYEGSLYLLGAGTRPDKPCGLYASWVTTDRPAWHNDFHLNYNYIAPFYGCYAANRPEIAESMVEPLLAAIPIGLRVAKRQLALLNKGYVASRADLANGIDDGLLLPVGILSRGFTSEGEASLWNQTMNAAFSAASFCTYYEYTLDEAYLARVYPFLEKTANFYVKWCERETLPGGGYRYSFFDSYGEGQGWGKNCSPTLGCVKHLFATLADVEKDAAKRKAWADYRDHLAELPQAVYAVKDFRRKILSLCETGDCRHMVRGTGAVELEAVIPGEAFAFDITDEYRTLATNTVDAMIAKTGAGVTWGNDNQTPKLFATAIRAGYPCRAVIDAFKRHQLAPKWQKNFTVHDGYHGIEKAGGIEFINSMLLQCDHGFVKVFPNWTGEDAAFENLRAKGAFLVSSAMKDGRVTHVTVTSLKGGVFRLVSPWKDYPTQGTTRNSKEPVIEIRLGSGQTKTLREL